MHPCSLSVVVYSGDLVAPGVKRYKVNITDQCYNITATLLNKINIETDSYKGLHSVERCLNIFFLPFSLANAKMTARPCSVYAAATVYSAGMTRLV